MGWKIVNYFLDPSPPFSVSPCSHVKNVIMAFIKVKSKQYLPQ